MEFNLDALKRDWIVGTAGSAFLKLVQQYIGQIEDVVDAAREQGVVIAELDPVKFAAAFFAASHSGVPTILANPKWQRYEWERLYQQVKPAIVFGVSVNFKSAPSETKSPMPGTILIPTGGSSGKLKLAVHTWDTLTAACDGFRSFAGTEPIHSCCVLPLYHVSGLMQMIRSSTSGGQIVFTDYRTLQKGQFPKIKAENLFLSLVPTQLQRIIEQKTVVDWLLNLKAIFLGGAPMSATLQARVREMRLPVVPSYGMTETAAMVTVLPTKDFLSGNIGVGYPLQHADIQVFGDNHLPCAPEEIGHIRIRTESLCLGYHELSSEILKNGYLLSTDEGYLDHDGCLHVIGRSDRIIISGGEKIDPLEIEDAFLKTGAVDQVLAMGWSDEEWGERLIAFYVPANDKDSVEALRQRLKSVLINYKIPRAIIKVSQLPLTSSGKPDHNLVDKLLERYV